MDGITRIFAETFSEELYSMDDTPLEKRLCELLKVRGKKISVAESFTGGGVGSRIVSVPGASEVYFEGLNTYNGDAKIKRLNVSPFTLNTSGARFRSDGVRNVRGTFIFGRLRRGNRPPRGWRGRKATKADSRGLMFSGCGLDGKIYIARHIFTGSRKEITEKAINHALFWAYKYLK